jgi:predicted RNase H-like HicB family nuclease
VKQTFTVVVERDPEGGWLVGEVVELPGCYSQAPDLPSLLHLSLWLDALDDGLELHNRKASEELTERLVGYGPTAPPANGVQPVNLRHRRESLGSIWYPIP